MNAIIVKEVASKIDVEIHHIVDEAYRDVEQLLTDNMDFLHNMAKALLEEETIDAKAVETFINMVLLRLLMK